MCLLRINVPNQCPDINHFDAVDFSECHWRSDKFLLTLSVFRVQIFSRFWTRWGNWRWLNVFITINSHILKWKFSWRLTREIRDNKTSVKITTYTVSLHEITSQDGFRGQENASKILDINGLPITNFKFQNFKNGTSTMLNSVFNIANFEHQLN